MDDGFAGNFTSLIGGDVSSLETTYLIGQNIQEGGLYRFRYRTRNVNGWSPFSDIAYLRAANVPVRPAAPTLSLVTETSIKLTLKRTLDDGGSNVLRYELYRN
jgi:hypothetical protein